MLDLILTTAQRVSATNCACLYHRSFSQANTPPEEWPFGFTITTEQVWDGFLTLSLLQNHDRLGLGHQLIVPHTGNQRDRFLEPMRAHNEHIRLHNLPEFRHFCNRCVRWYTDD